MLSLDANVFVYANITGEKITEAISMGET